MRLRTQPEIILRLPPTVVRGIALSKATAVSSIGLCTRCVDISASISSISEIRDDKYKNYNFTLPNGISISDGSKGVDGYPYINTSWVSADYGSLAQKYNEIGNFTILQFTEAGPGCFPPNATSDTGNRLWCQNKITFPKLPHLDSSLSIMAAQCSYEVCLKNFASRVVAGVVEEIPISTTPATFQAGLDILPDLMALKLPCVIGDDLYEVSNISDIDPHSFKFVNMSTSVDRGPYLTYPEPCAYGMSGIYVRALQLYLKSALTDVGLANPRGGVTGNGILANPVFDKWWLASFYQQGNATFDSVTANVENVATTLTNYVRVPRPDKLLEYRASNRSSDAPSVVTGIVHRTSICTQFNWRWLLFPAGLILATAVLLFLTTIFRHCDKGYLPNWKASLLPLLFYGFVSSDSASSVRSQQGRRGNVNPDLMPSRLFGLSRLDELADSTIVQFRRTSGGAGFEVLE